MRISNQYSTTHRFYPWLVILLAASFLFYKYILQVSPSTMIDELMSEFHVEGAGLGNLAASFFYSFLIAQLFVGVLLDRYSPRLLTTTALLLCALGVYSFSTANSVVLAAWSRTLMGVGAAFATVSYMKMTSLWFKPKQFAFVGGLLASAAMLGAIAGQMPLSLVVNKVGWRNSLGLCAILGVFLAALFYLIVRDKPKNQSVVVAAPQFFFRDVWAVLTNTQNWLITLYSGLAFSPIDAFAGLWSIPFLRQAYQLTHTHAAFFVSFIFFGLALGSPLLGLLSDRLGQRRCIMLGSGCIALASITPVLYSTHLPLFLLGCLLFLFGFFTGAFMLGFALGKDLNKLTVAATIIALINTGDVIFSAFTEPLIGKLLDLGWNGQIVSGIHYFSVIDYRRALTLLPVYILLSITLLIFIREPNIPQKNV
jgi:MFS family permease